MRDKLTLTIPINQQSHLRPISSINQINKCVSILKSKPKISVLKGKPKLLDSLLVTATSTSVFN